MTTRSDAIERVLNRLRSKLGLGESPDGSNHNEITEWYNANVDKIGNGPWCEMTNTWSTWTGGAKEIKRGRAYTVFAAGDAVGHVNGSEWHWGTKGMRAGDHVYYDWKGGKGKTSIVDHTGTVEKVFGDGTFYALEGNTVGNKLLRQRRDSKYVVGYARLDYESLVPPKEPAPVEKPKPTIKPKGDKDLVKKIQRVLKVAVDGDWGKQTDARALLMRKAAQATVGSPHRVGNLKNLDVRLIQRVVGTEADGVWGPRSQASMAMWVKLFQRATDSEVGGHWGPKTDNAFLKARAHNLNKS